jgi:hypothetical protein
MRFWQNKHQLEILEDSVREMNSWAFLTTTALRDYFSTKNCNFFIHANIRLAYKKETSMNFNTAEQKALNLKLAQHQNNVNKS